MKLTYDKSLLDKGRRIVAFRIEPGDSPAELTGRLASLFGSPCAVAYSPFGEHRLPTAKCSPEALTRLFSELSVKRIEIGEGAGKTDTEFIIDFAEKNLDCIGPLEYNFYKLFNENGISFSI